jgi:hypothetical protein
MSFQVSTIFIILSERYSWASYPTPTHKTSAQLSNLTVKTVLSRTSGGKGLLDIALFQISECYALCKSKVYPAPSWTDLTQFVTWYPVHISLLHFEFPFHHYLHNKMHIKCKKREQYLTLLIIIQYCIHFTKLHAHVGVTIFTVHLHNFTW